jgi:hypothetical protein
MGYTRYPRYLNSVTIHAVNSLKNQLIILDLVNITSCIGILPSLQTDGVVKNLDKSLYKIMTI